MQFLLEYSLDVCHYINEVFIKGKVPFFIKIIYLIKHCVNFKHEQYHDGLVNFI